ncbi:hypothetical protein DPMN_016848 [Dreissena polymorpha]|uniref:Uncharacterized protein n=1 Tax=Dreissena polymorpha TaxID=45954 RepID=A0A9D4NGE1_DREPO|nr:hypothetical protein DPMN_016848 [Dreissena polymorpha]
MPNLVMGYMPPIKSIPSFMVTPDCAPQKAHPDKTVRILRLDWSYAGSILH